MRYETAHVIADSRSHPAGAAVEGRPQPQRDCPADSSDADDIAVNAAARHSDRHSLRASSYVWKIEF